MDKSFEERIVEEKKKYFKSLCQINLDNSYVVKNFFTGKPEMVHRNIYGDILKFEEIKND